MLAQTIRLLAARVNMYVNKKQRLVHQRKNKLSKETMQNFPKLNFITLCTSEQKTDRRTPQQIKMLQPVAKRSNKGGGGEH